MTTLEINGPKVSLNGIINGQVEMTKFIMSEGILQNDLKLICNELKQLKELDISSSENQSSEFAELSKLSKLKKLKISFVNNENSTFNESLSLVENGNLLDLDIYPYRNELWEPTLISLGLNCPKLTKLKIHSRSLLNVINPIINYFPFMIDLELYGLIEKSEKPFIFQGGLVHHNLRKLTIIGPNGDCQDFPKLVGALQNLQQLRISIPISGQLLKEILMIRPELKNLDLTPEWSLMTKEHKLTQDFVDTLREHGTHLETFKGEFYGLHCDMKLDIIQEQFRKLFTIANVNDGFGIVEWIMKK